MREILFRGFHECENGTQKAYYGGEWHKGKWVYGYYVPCCLGRFPCVPCIVPEPTGMWEPIEVAHETVCQCTEIDDKNSKKIYEGDIVKKFYGEFGTDYLVGVVVYREDVGSYMVKVIYGICPMPINMRFLEIDNHLNACEIIGNKFVNPGVLEKEECQKDD